MSFKYERLPNHCYWCGNLTHMDKECSIWTKRKGALLEAEQQFGLWLRATTPNLARKIVVRVAGFEEEGSVVGDQSTVKTPGAGAGARGGGEGMCKPKRRMTLIQLVFSKLTTRIFMLKVGREY